MKSLAALNEVVAFFEERRGRLYGFRWRDRLDHVSSLSGAPISPLDQTLGTGDGSRATYPLLKTYGALHAPYARAIAKPVAGSVRVAIAGLEQAEGSAFACDPASGLVTFLPGHLPGPGARVSAGFMFDVPVRFDTDFLEVNLTAFAAGEIPRIPIIEIRP